MQNNAVRKDRRPADRFANMITLSNSNISALLALCAGNSPVTDEFPQQRPVTRSFDVFFGLWLRKTIEYTTETPVIWDANAVIMTSLLHMEVSWA